MPVELRPSPYKNVLGDSQSSQRPIRKVAVLESRRSFVRDEEHQVVVAIRGGITAGGGAEEVDPQRMIGL